MKSIIDMGYLIYKVPNYKNWVNDDILCDFNKLQKHLAKYKAEDDMKKALESLDELKKLTIKTYTDRNGFLKPE